VPGARDAVEEFVAARRPALARAVVLLGRPPSYAAGVVDAVLRPALARLERDDDPDRAAWAAVLRRLREDRDPTWWTLADEPPLALAALLVRLDALTPDVRAALVHEALVGGASIGPSIGPSEAPADAPTPAEVQSVALEVPVPGPGEVVAVRGARPRRLLLGAAATVLIGLVGLGAVVVTGGTEPEASAEPGLDAVAVRAAETSQPLSPRAWWAAGEVHWDDRVLAVGGLVALVEVDDVLVYVDNAGRVIRLDRDGARTRLGEADPGGGLAAEPVSRQVAWVEPGDEDSARLVVARLGEGEGATAVAQRDIGAEASVVALDPTRLWFVDGDDSVEWRFGRDEVTALPEGLLDVGSDHRLRQVARGSVRAERLSDPTVGVEVDGRGGRLAPGALFLLTADPSTDSTVRVHSVRGGGEVRTGLEDSQQVLEARFTGDSTLTVVVADASVAEGGTRRRVRLVDLQTCVLGTGRCVEHAAIRLVAGGVVLAG